jgi:hypothetical protein
MERKGHIRQGLGGKAAETRYRAVCDCGFETKWRKFRPAVEEDCNEHIRETQTNLPIPSDIDAVRINEILKGKYYDFGGVAWWWSTANSHLEGKSPLELWPSEEKPSVTTIERLRNAAMSADLMGHAT